MNRIATTLSSWFYDRICRSIKAVRKISLLLVLTLAVQVQNF